MKTAHALLALLMSSSAMAEEPPETATTPQPFFYGAAVTKHCLTNGVRLRSHNLPGSHTVTLTTLVDTGDSPYLAQVAARLWLRSVTLPPEPEPEPVVEETEPDEAAEPLPPITRVDVYPGPPTMAQRLLAVGARTETVTTPDHTAFTTAVLLENLDGMLALERLRLSEPLSGITQADLDAVIDELATERATPGTTMWGPLSSLLFAGTPAASAVTLAAVQEYVATAWAPGQTTMNLTGDLSGLGNLDLFLRAGLVDPPAPPAPPLAEGEEAPPPAPAGFVIVDDSCGVPVDSAPTTPSDPVTASATLPAAVTTPQLIMAWSLPGSWHEDHTLVEAFPALAERYISEGFANTTTPGTTSEEIVSCELLPGLEASVMTCQLPLARTKDAGGVQRSAVIGLDPLWFPNNLPTLRDRMPEIREGVRRNLLRRASGFNNGDTDELVRAAAHARYRVEEVPYIPQISEAADLEAEPLLKMARAWLNPVRAVSVVLTPDGYRPDHASRDVSRRLIHDAWAPYPLENPEEPEQPPLAEGEEYPEVPVQPVQPLPEPMPADEILALASTPQLDGAIRTTLDNGMSVLIVPRSGYPVVHTSLIHAGGLLRETEPGVDGLTWDLSSPFSPNKDQFVPEHPLEGQAWWEAERRTDGWVRTLSGPQPNLEGLLYILRETTTDPSIDTRARNEYFYRLGHQEPGAWTVASRLSQREYFGDHPLGLAVPTKKALKKLTDQPDAWAASVVNPHATTLLVIGPVDPEATKAAIESTFGDWAAAATPATASTIKPVTAPGTGSVVVDAPLESAQVRLRCPISGTSARTDLLATMLEARMWESAHGTLSPSILRIDTHQTPGDIAWMSFYAEVDPAQTGAVVNLMRSSMTDYVAELEGVLTERTIREAFDTIIAADAGLRRPKMTDEAGVALLAALTDGTRPPEEIEKGMEALMEQLAEPEEGEEEVLEEGEVPLREALSEDALALISAAAELLAEEPEEEEEAGEPDEEAEPEPIEVTFVRHPVTLDDARLALAAQHGISMHTTDALRSTLVDQILLGRDLSALTGYGAALHEVTEQELIDEVGRCLGRTNLTVLGPMLTVAPQVRAAGYQRVELPKKWWK